MATVKVSPVKLRKIADWLERHPEARTKAQIKYRSDLEGFDIDFRSPKVKALVQSRSEDSPTRTKILALISKSPDGIRASDLMERVQKAGIELREPPEERHSNGEATTITLQQLEEFAKVLKRNDFTIPQARIALDKLERLSL